MHYFIPFGLVGKITGAGLLLATPPLFYFFESGHMFKKLGHIVAQTDRWNFKMGKKI